ncbi:hypothetical protein OBE_13454, partial [human gut metagenome]
KQLYKVMDQIVKTDVNEEEIAPFMEDINIDAKVRQIVDSESHKVTNNIGSAGSWHKSVYPQKE